MFRIDISYTPLYNNPVETLCGELPSNKFSSLRKCRVLCKIRIKI